MTAAKPHSTFYDIQVNSKRALEGWNVGVGTGVPFDFGDAEVQVALNAANDGLLALGDAVRRAQARYAIDVAHKQIELAERVLTEVVPLSAPQRREHNETEPV